METASLPLPAARIMFLAGRNPRRAVGLARRSFAHTQGADRAWLCLALGVALLHWERFAEAATVLALARERFTVLGDQRAALIARRWELANARWLTAASDLPAQIALLGADCRAAGLELEAARAEFEHIAWLNVCGRFAEARDLADELAPVVALRGAPADQGRLLRLQAVTSLGEARFDMAEHQLHAAERCYRQAGHRIEALKTACEQARLFQYREEYNRALPLLQRYLELFRTLDLPFWQALIAKHLSVVADALGLSDQAIMHAMEARTIFEAYQRRDYAVDCDFNIGNVAYRSGLYELARATYQRAEASYVSLGWQRMALICKFNLALVLRAQGQPLAAMRLITAIARRAEAQQHQRDLADIVQVQGLLLRDLGDVAEAETRLEQAAERFLALGNSAAVAKCRLEQAWIALEQQDVARAEWLFQAARDGLSERKPHRWRIEYGLARCAELRATPATALAHYRVAVTTVACMRDRLASEHAASAVYAQARRLFTEALRLALQLDARETILEFAEQQRRLAHADRAHNATQAFFDARQATVDRQRQRLQSLLESVAPAAQIDAALQEYIAVLLHRQHQRPLPAKALPPLPTVGELRRRFDAAYAGGWCLLVYVPYGDHLLVVALSSTGFTVDQIQLDAEFQAALTRATHPAYREYTYLDLAYHNGMRSEAWSDLAMLGERLIPPAVWPALEAERRLMVVPCGMLHGLPWAALRIDDHWLIERAVIQQMPSVRCWLALQERAAPGRRALVLGVHHFQERAPDLPDSAAAADVLARYWAGPLECYRDEALGRQELLARAARGQLRSYGLLHLCTHGRLLAAHGLLAHLKLYDSDLFYDDVASLNLGPGLVVLATCDGACCEVLPGEEVISISNGFLRAGARDVVASLWQVYAAVLPLFMELFYAALSNGADAPSALAQAQRTLIARRSGDTADDAVLNAPLAWANMCASGAGTRTVTEWQLPAATAATGA